MRIFLAFALCLFAAAGVRSLEMRKPADEQTLFGIASNREAYTTAALLLHIKL